jgi:hypothetical protein
LKRPLPVVRSHENGQHRHDRSSDPVERLVVVGMRMDVATARVIATPRVSAHRQNDADLIADLINNERYVPESQHPGLRLPVIFLLLLA